MPAENDDLNPLDPTTAPLPNDGENERRADAAGSIDPTGLVDLAGGVIEAGGEIAGMVGNAAGEVVGAAGEAAGEVVGAVADGASGCSCSVVVLLAVCLSAGSAIAAHLLH